MDVHANVSVIHKPTRKYKRCVCYDDTTILVHPVIMSLRYVCDKSRLIGSASPKQNSGTKVFV